MIKERNLTVYLLLTILTFGLYGIVWFITLSDDTSMAAEDSTMSGVVALLITLITCGIYKFYWNYKIGKLLYTAKCNNGLYAKDNAVLYLLLGLLGLDIVNYCLMQADLNDIAEAH